MYNIKNFTIDDTIKLVNEDHTINDVRALVTVALLCNEPCEVTITEKDLKNILPTIHSMFNRDKQIDKDKFIFKPLINIEFGKCRYGETTVQTIIPTTSKGIRLYSIARNLINFHKNTKLSAVASFDNSDFSALTDIELENGNKFLFRAVRDGYLMIYTDSSKSNFSDEELMDMFEKSDFKYFRDTNDCGIIKGLIDGLTDETEERIFIKDLEKRIMELVTESILLKRSQDHNFLIFQDQDDLDMKLSTIISDINYNIFQDTEDNIHLTYDITDEKWGLGLTPSTKKTSMTIHVGVDLDKDNGLIILEVIL